MASYTMQLREFIEMQSQDEPDLNYKDRIEIGRPKLFDFDYPIFDNDYKKTFETNFIKNFYMREIGFETEGLFKMRLDTWLNINMPYFNELFKSEQLKYDPLSNAQMLTAHEKNNETDKKEDRLIDQNVEEDGTFKTTGEIDGKSKTTAKEDSDSSSKSDSTRDGTHKTDTDTNNFNRKLESDNPDSRLSITPNTDGSGSIDYANKIEENKGNNKEKESGETTTKDKSNASGETHVDSVTDGTTHMDSENDGVTHDEKESNTKDDFKSNMTEEELYLQRTYGKIGAQSYASLVQDYRNALLRIERQIFNEMQELFMLVY